MGCPYTWFRNKVSFLNSKEERSTAIAQHLHVRVFKDGEERVAVALPANSARWLIELIPQDVVDKIYAEKIPLDEMLEDLKTMEVMRPQPIFSLSEPGRQVDIWLE